MYLSGVGEPLLLLLKELAEVRADRGVNEHRLVKVGVALRRGLECRDKPHRRVLEQALLGWMSHGKGTEQDNLHVAKGYRNRFCLTALLEQRAAYSWEACHTIKVHAGWEIETDFG